MTDLTQKVKQDLQLRALPRKKPEYERFFKTGKGEYGEGDQFLGVNMPAQREIAKKYFRLADLYDVEKLLQSPFHEHRMVGLLILTYQFPKLNAEEQARVYNFYLGHTERINNWDLVDVTTPKVVGQYLLEHPRERKILFKLVQSQLLWERRIAVLATYPLIRSSQFSEILKLSQILLCDEEDLIHKAGGWMLRELGKKDEKVLTKFLNNFATKMPRTMLRYAIEKFKEPERQYFLKLK